MNLQRLTLLTTNFTEASDARLNAFAFDHIQRLTQANASGALSTRLTEVQSAYTACFGTMSDEAQATAQREGLTQTANQALAALKDALSDGEAAVQVAFGKDSATYQEFFPQGLTEYRRATLTTASALFTRFVDTAKAHQAALGAAFASKYEGLLAAYLTAHSAQRIRKGAVSELKAASCIQRDLLEKILWKSALLLAAEHVGDSAALGVYFDTTRL
ncbi:hypothetical protein [Armatimonas sp.]|uniref:hypothetical protein n=1 Tax=Armatimonas sp. TaxID=1872638 RepID=UPI003751A885